MSLTTITLTFTLIIIVAVLIRWLTNRPTFWD